MSSKTWFFSDPHFGHSNIITFKDDNGKLIRPFNSIEEHDQTIIDNINAVVKPTDRLYIMGDVAMAKRHIETVGRLNGKKKLIKGNHDPYPPKEYLTYFEDIVAYRIYPAHSLVVSHIPIHTCNLDSRFKFNAHGHLHANLIPDDNRYINLCPEHTDFKPVELEELLETLKNREI